jgi:hypothetical protein
MSGHKPFDELVDILLAAELLIAEVSYYSCVLTCKGITREIDSPFSLSCASRYGTKGAALND